MSDSVERPAAGEQRSTQRTADGTADRVPLARPRADLTPLGDAAVVVQFGDQIDRGAHRAVRALADYLDEHPLPGMMEYASAFT